MQGCGKGVVFFVFSPVFSSILYTFIELNNEGVNKRVHALVKDCEAASLVEDSKSMRQ